MSNQLLDLLRDLLALELPDLGTGVTARLTLALIGLLRNFATLLTAIAAICPAFATALATCTATGGSSTLSPLPGLIEDLLELLASPSPDLPGIDDVLDEILSTLPPLLSCVLPSLANCCPTTPGQACCPGFGGGAPISISINNTNTASNDDRDQVQAQSAGKDANQNQTQVHTDTTAGRDALVQIDAFTKKFSEFDDKLKYLFCKLKSEVHEQDHHKCKCKVSCKKH